MCVLQGNLHDVSVELEGMGGGGKLQLEVSYTSILWKLNIFMFSLNANTLLLVCTNCFVFRSLTIFVSVFCKFLTQKVFFSLSVSFSVLDLVG